MVAQAEACTMVRDAGDVPNLLELNRNDAEDWLNAWNANPDNQWNRENLFVFLAPKLSPFSLGAISSREFPWILFLTNRPASGRFHSTVPKE